MKRSIWIVTLIGFFVLLMLYSGSSRPPRETRIEDLVINPQIFDEKEVLVSGNAIRASVYEDGTAEILIKEERGDERVLIIINSSLLNKIPEKGDRVAAKGTFTTSGQPHIDAYVAHVRPIWGHRLIFLRSIAAIPLILYFIRQGWDLVRV